MILMDKTSRKESKIKMGKLPTYSSQH